MKKGLFNGIKMLLAVVLAIVTAAMFVACDRGNTGGGDLEEDAVAPVISGFTVQADDGATFGKVGEAHKLSYTVTGTCTSESVSVKKDGAAASADSYEYTTQTKKIVFKEAGEYTVTLTAMNGAKGSSANANVSVTAFDAPTITAVLAQTVYVDTAVDFAPTATYAEGDAAGIHSLAVLYCATEDGEYVAATSSQYTYVNNKFTALALGYYKITLTVTSLKGATAQQDYTVHSIGIGTMNLNHDYGATRILVEKDALTTLNYTAEGGIAEDFDITYDYDETKLTVVAGEGSSIKVTATENGDYNIKVIYTHKGDEEAVSDLTFNITVKDDINAPVLGADPFGGTWSTLMPNVGMLLYFDATDDKVANLQYGTHVTYEVTSSGTINASQASINNVGDNTNYPYLVTTQTSGTIVVRITVADNSGNSATAEKTFTVSSFNSLATYGASVYKNTDNAYPSSFVLDGYQCDDNLVVSKNGVIVNRADASTAAKSVAGVRIERAADNFEVVVDLTVIKNGELNTFWFTPFTVAANDNNSDNNSAVGNIGFNWRTDNTKINHSWGDAGFGTATSNHSSIDRLEVGQTYKIKLTHTVSGNNAVWKIDISSDGGSTYQTVISSTATADTSVNGNAGAQVTGIYFWQCDSGTYMLSNATWSAINA